MRGGGYRGGGVQGVGRWFSVIHPLNPDKVGLAAGQGVQPDPVIIKPTAQVDHDLPLPPRHVTHPNDNNFVRPRHQGQLPDAVPVVVTHPPCGDVAGLQAADEGSG